MALADLRREQGRYTEGAALYRELISIQLQRTDDLLDEDWIRGKLMTLLEEWRANLESTLGHEHADALAVRRELGVLSFETGDASQALVELADCWEAQRATLGDTAPGALETQFQVARVLEALGDLDQAESCAGALLDATDIDDPRYEERRRLFDRIRDRQ